MMINYTGLVLLLIYNTASLIHPNRTYPESIAIWYTIPFHSGIWI